MRTSLVIVLGVMLTISPLASQELRRPGCGEWDRESLPGWFIPWFSAHQLAQTHEVACYLNPFYQRGNFEGQGRLDLAVLVVEKHTGKRGILVVHRPSLNGYLLGAGTPIGNGGDDFWWVGYWRVEAAIQGPNVAADPVPRIVGEVLYVVKPEAASAWLGWTGPAVRMVPGRRLSLGCEKEPTQCG